MRPDRTLPTQTKATRILKRQDLAACANLEIHRVERLQNRVAGVALTNQQARVVGIERRPVRIVSAQPRRWAIGFVRGAHYLCTENRIDKLASRAWQRRQ